MGLYVLDLASGEVRKVLKISEKIQGQEHRLVNVDGKRAVLAWFGNDKVCMATRDNSIIAVDCNDGHIETLVTAGDRKIWGPVSVSPNKLRFLEGRSTDQGWEIEVCDFDGTKVISNGIIPVNVDKYSNHSLSANGKYAFVFVWVKKHQVIFPDKIVIFDLSQWTTVKKIQISVDVDSKSYIYIPVTVLKDKQLVLLTKELDFSTSRLQSWLSVLEL